MYNLPDDPFTQLKKRIRLRMKEEMVDKKVQDLITGAYDHALASENIILSRSERIRLFRALLYDIFDDISNNRS